MYTKDYIQATYETIRNGSDANATLSALSLYLKKRGLVKLYPSILRGLMERMKRSTVTTTQKVTTARTGDLKKHEKEIHTLLKELGGDTAHTHHVDENIIGGFIIEGSNKRIDKSYKHTLLQAYRRLSGSN